MKIQSAAVILILAMASVAAGAGGEQSIDSKAQDIIARQCTGCHDNARIKSAFTTGKDMRAIQQEMQRRGAKLSGSEQEVLGIYWKHSPQLK